MAPNRTSPALTPRLILLPSNTGRQPPIHSAQFQVRTVSSPHEVPGMYLSDGTTQKPRQLTKTTDTFHHSFEQSMGAKQRKKKKRRNNKNPKDQKNKKKNINISGGSFPFLMCSCGVFSNHISKTQRIQAHHIFKFRGSSSANTPATAALCHEADARRARDVHCAEALRVRRVDSNLPVEWDKGWVGEGEGPSVHAAWPPSS